MSFDPQPPSAPTVPEGLGPVARVLATAVLVLAIQCVFVWLAIDDLDGPDVRVTGQLTTLFVGVIGFVLVILAGRVGTSLKPTAITFTIAVAIALSAVVPAALAGSVARRRAEVALGAWVASSELAALEREHGYSSQADLQLPQVSRPVSTHRGQWMARESDRPEGTTPIAADARGAVVLVREDGTCSLDPAHVSVRARAARTSHEIAWVAFVSRSWPVVMGYTNGLETSTERVDVRIVDLALGAVVARASLGAVAPRTTPRVAQQLRVFEDLVSRAIILALDEDQDATRPPETSWDVEGCEVPAELSTSEHDPSEACLEGVTAECARACREGAIEACLDAAYTLDHASAARARPYYALACRAGDANACTNFAAGLLEYPEDPAALACARTVFERTYAAGDLLSYGMLAELLARGQGGEEDDARARTILEASCDEDNAFSCDVLGSMLRDGDLGDEPAVP